MTIGTVEKQMPLVLHRRIGDAKGSKHSYEIFVTEPLSSPMIVRDDGLTFTLTWDDVISMAVEAFETSET